MEAVAALPALASAAGTAGAGMSSIAAAGSSGLTALQGASSVVSMLGQLAGGNAARQAGEIQSLYANLAADQMEADLGLAREATRIEATQEFLMGQQRVIELRRQLAADLGNNSVAYAASGVDFTQGTPVRRAEALEETAASDIRIEQANTQLRRLAALIRGSQQQSAGMMEVFGLRSSGQAALDRGQDAQGAAIFGAIGTALNFGADVVRRGGPTGGPRGDVGLGSWAATVTGA